MELKAILYGGKWVIFKKALNLYLILFMHVLILQMWKASAGHSISLSQDDGADDWETDPDFVVQF